MWIEDLREAGDHFEGTIANEAVETSAVKLGDTVTVKLDEITDWKYIDGDRLVGGYTIRYLYNRMTDAEKKAFLKEIDFIID